MKKLLLIFMLILLPFQASWAAAAAYCQHEQGAAVAHFGHHSHQHQADNDAPDGKGKAAKLHGDCAYCHLASQASFVATEISVMLLGDPARIEPYRFAFSSHIGDGPRKPDRHPVA